MMLSFKASNYFFLGLLAVTACSPKIDRWLKDDIETTLYDGAGTPLKLGKVIPPPESTFQLLAALHRKQCYPDCPAYSLVVHQDGRVVWVGRAEVERYGLFESYLAPDEIDRLIASFKERLFFDLDPTYPSNARIIDELPTSVLQFSWEGRSHQVLHNYFAPPEVQELEQLLDSLAARLDWSPLPID
jgi:hypothetical protein